MSDAAETRVDTPTKRGWFRSSLRPLLRAVHRDAGYLAVGLTLIYATSGLAVNHIADWDPNFHQRNVELEIGPVTDANDDAAAATVLSRMGIRATPTDVYRAGDELTVLLDHRTLHVSNSGHVLDEGQSPRFFLRIANWLHLNRGKKAWTYFADAYAAGLLLLAISGLFMIPGKKGLIGRGGVLVAIGIAAPLLYVGLSKGP